MKVVFMGTPDFAVESLKALQRNHQVLCVLTQPDRTQGRNKKIVFSPVKELALQYNIPVLQPERIRNKETLAELKAFDADIFVVAAYGQILSEKILSIPRFGCICVHGSLLPKYRGAAPVQWSIINGEPLTGVTIMKMDKGIDTGDILLKREMKIENYDTGGSLYNKMAELGAKALLDAMALIERGEAVYTKQNNDEASYVSVITKETGRIDFSKTSREIVNLVRGLSPWEAAYTQYNSAPLKIWRAAYAGEITGGEPGEIIEIKNNKGIIVKTGDAAVLLEEIQASGGKRMEATAYARGHNMKAGEKFEYNV